MNIGGSFGGGYGGYRPMESSSYGAAPAAQKDGFESRRQSMAYGDSLSVTSLGRRETRTVVERSPEETADRLKKGRTVCWVLGAIGLFVFGIMAVQPILLPLCTLGMCFANGWSEWLEFTTTIFKMSLFPASFGALFFGGALLLDQSLKAVEAQVGSQQEGKLTPEMMEQMLKQGQAR